MTCNLCIQIKWTEPEDDGGRDVYEYHLQIRSTVKGQETATQQVMQCFSPLLDDNSCKGCTVAELISQTD